MEGRVPEGSVCNVKNRNPRISASAMLVTQFLLPVVLEITCNKTATLINILPPGKKLVLGERNF